MSNNAHELSNRLLNALDNNYNVVDMHAVNEIISILEKINITKELLETTRLGKHVNELRRKTTEPTLARRAKVLVKRWRDLVIPTSASPHHTAGSNRSSAERTMRRLGTTPITSPAFARQVVSPAVPSPRPPSRPAWGGYESDSQDVILVDDDPAPPAPPPAPPVSPKRPTSPETHDEKKAKRDKKPKKRRGHSRAGSGSESPAGAWAGRNGAAPERKKNGVRGALDPYAALVHRMPPAGAKKVKTTQELLAQIQSRGGRRSPRSPLADSADPDVLLIEPDEPSPVKAESPLRNGVSPAPPSPRARSPRSPPRPLEDARSERACSCGAGADPQCAAARRARVLPAHVAALHHAYLPGVNGTRAPLHPHQFAVRKLHDPARPDLFTSVVPLYAYSDYADDYCVKNLVRVPLCTHLPWTEFAPSPPDLPPPRSPPPVRPYPLDDELTPAVVKVEVDDDDPPLPAAEVEVDADELTPAAVKMEVDADEPTPAVVKIEVDDDDADAEPAEEPETPPLEPGERLKAPLLATEDETIFQVKKCESVKVNVADEFASEQREHRTVERTKPTLDGRALYEQCESARAAIPFVYEQASAAPTVTLPAEPEAVGDALQAALEAAAASTERDALGRPVRPAGFAEWHECAKLGDLIALPYVVID